MLPSISLSCIPNFTSYGTVATNLLKELTKLGVQVSLFPIIDNGIEAYPEDHDLIRSCLHNAQLFDYDAPSVRLWHQNSLAQHCGRGKRIGFSIFELDKFSKLELHHFRSQDELVCCSRWAIGTLLENGMTQPIHVVPLGVDTDIFHPNYHKDYLKRKSPGSTVFINAGKKEARKGHDFLLKCFNKAFNENDNVELHMIWANRILDYQHPKESAAWDRMYLGSKLGSKITLYPWLSSQKEVAQLMTNADCGVFPARAEGFNLDLLECLACGIRVITTNVTAHTEYINNYNSMIMPVSGSEIAYDGIFFKDNIGQWASFDGETEYACIEYMRSVHKWKQDGDNIFNKVGFETAKQFSWQNTALRLIEALTR